MTRNGPQNSVDEPNAWHELDESTRRIVDDKKKQLDTINKAQSSVQGRDYVLASTFLQSYMEKSQV